MQFIMIYGNPVDGCRYVGPFASRDETLRYSEIERVDWWIAELDAPADDPKE